MINAIRLQSLLPQIFVQEQASIVSDVWLTDWTIERGQSYLIEAASGRGKSSLCSYLYGLRSDYNGILTFDGQDARTFTAGQWNQLHCSALSLLFQEHRLFAELTAFENICIKNQLTHYRTETEIQTMLDALGIGAKRDTPASHLSLGQQQRVAFVRMLCQPADFYLLDEPVSHLDEDNAQIMSRMLADSAQKQGASVVVTSIGKRLPYNYGQILKL